MEFEEGKLRQLHFIVVPFPAQGHLNPLMHLSTTLAQNGALVTVLNIEPVHGQLQSRLSCPSSSNLKLVAMPFELDAPTGVNSFWYSRLREFAQAMSRLPGIIQELVGEIILDGSRAAESRKYVLISDHFMRCRNIARHFGAVFVNYWPGTATWYLIHHHLRLLASRGDIVVQDPEKVITYVPGVEPLRLADFPNYVHPGNPESGDIGYFLEAPTACRDEWFFINSVYDLEPKAYDVVKELLGSRCVSIAPSFRSQEEAPAASFSLRDEDFSCIKWLDMQKPSSVLYVSFGSIAPVSEVDVLALAEALEVGKVKFLWVVKQEHFPREHAEFFSNFMLRNDKSEKGVVVEWAPQVEILAHGAVGGFVSHCGWNSVIESISCGVPIIGWPCISEQRLNCKLVVEDWKMGMRVNKVNKQELASILSKFMSNREVFAKNAGTLQRFARASVLSENLRDFLRDIAMC